MNFNNISVKNKLKVLYYSDIHCTYHPNKENSETSFVTYVCLCVMKPCFIRFKFLMSD